MFAPQVISSSAYRRSVWKNGLGHTDEIAIFPEGADLRAGNFLWRLSSARIEKASPFSAFPHHDRTLVILQGDGVRLTHTFEGDEDTVEVPLLEPYEFPGDVPSRCELIGAGVQDLSVFVRKAEVDAVTHTVAVEEGRSYSWRPEGRWNFAYAVGGAFTVDGDLRLPAGDTLRVDLAGALGDEDGVRLTAESRGGHLVLVSLQG